MFSVLATTGVQILGDIGCAILSLYLFLVRNHAKELKIFYGLIFFSFCALLIGDVYYNYMYRIMNSNIRESTGYLVTLCFVSFQISQLYSWLYLILKQKIKVFSQQNIPYLLCTGIVTCVLIYFFQASQNYPTSILLVQSLNVASDMVIWLFAIICFANTRSYSISLLTLGSLMIISSDLTTRCLYIFEPMKLPSTMWVHVIWALGVVAIFFGLIYCIKNKEFSFASENSLQVTSSSRMVLTSFISFTLGVGFLTLFKLNNDLDMHAILWSLPIVIIFTLIISITLARKFSELLAEPINEILRLINLFSLGKDSSGIALQTKIHEFNLLGKFIDSTIKQLSEQLDREVKMAAQVAHDIRSPLSALQILTEQQLIGLEESKRILLRDAVYQIRDIINNLDQSPLPKTAETQIAILLEHVLSERRAAFHKKNIVINQNLGIEGYGLFVKALPSDLNRVITNLINNAVEAINSDKGVIDVSLSGDKESVLISITDNGCGVPNEIKQMLFVHGFTTKKTGSGLGLFSAKEIITKLGGEIHLESVPNIQTTITIKLPSKTPPLWFATHVEFSSDSTIICVDDSISIWNAWRERLESINHGMISRYCNNKASLVRELGREQSSPRVYLVDYEFSGESYTGLDLIDKILAYKTPLDQVFLVTSRAGEEIYEYCIEKNILIISKFFAMKIPIVLTDPVSQ